MALLKRVYFLASCTVKTSIPTRSSDHYERKRHLTMGVSLKFLTQFYIYFEERRNSLTNCEKYSKAQFRIPDLYLLYKGTVSQEKYSVKLEILYL